MIQGPVEVILAYLLADFLTGIYHYATDKGWNFKGQVALFQAHHESNSMSGFDWQPMLAGLPAMVAGLWLLSPFLLALGSFGILSQVPHYYAHRRSGSSAVHAVVKFLQRTGLILTPQHHAEHHRGAFDKNFCILSGWCNPLLNFLIGASKDVRVRHEHDLCSGGAVRLCPGMGCDRKHTEEVSPGNLAA